MPFPESALNEEAGKLFMEDYEEYAKLAKMMTQLHALPKEKIMKSPSVKETLVYQLILRDVSLVERKFQ